MKQLLTILFFLLSAAVFCAGIFYSSPYRLLRPYSVKNAEDLIPGPHELSISGTHWMIRIPFEDGDFYIDQIPVPVKDYRMCVETGRCNEPHYQKGYKQYYSGLLGRFFPVTFVSWSEAEAYCSLLGGHLPSERQWLAAAGVSEYPWGKDAPNFGRANYDGYYQSITPSGWLPKGVNEFGLLDISGNIREWTLDTITTREKNMKPEDILAYLNESPTHFNEERIIKGGGAQDFSSDIRNESFMIHLEYSSGFNRGFRCVFPVTSDQ